MDDLLGIGGESIVIKFQSQSGLIAIKIIPLPDSDGKTKSSVQNDQNLFKTSKLEIVQEIEKVSVPKKGLMNEARRKFGMKQKFKEIEKIVEVEKLVEVEPAEPINLVKSKKESENILKNEAEFECSSIHHPNIIGYQNVTLDIVDDYAALLAGNKAQAKNKIREFCDNRL